MAKTNKIAGLIKQPEVPAAAALRSGQSKPAVLYLLELRSRHTAAQLPLPRRRLAVKVDPQHNPHTIPKPVKIFHT